MNIKQNGKYGRDVWEEKIKAQNEVGVIHGTTSSISKVNAQTKEFMNFFDKEINPLLKKQSKILDLGVGPMARFSIEFAKRGHSVTGVDISPTTLKYAKKYIERSNEKIILIEDDISSLSKINTKHDLIFCYETFFHIPPHLTLKALKRFNELVKENGFCLVQFGIKGETSLKTLLHDSIYFVLHNLKKLFFKTFKVNVSRFTEAQIFSMAKESGFKIIKAYKNKGIYLMNKR